MVVNRIWQHHFGRGIAGTPSDFGRLGEPPSHPELLDWLASEFVARGWRWKPIHRMIVTSAVYRQASHRPLDEVVRAARIDPQDRLLWKQTVRRLDAEEIRDAMLAASGELDPRIGGPSEEATRSRRTIETRIVRNAPDALLSAFDAPDGSGSTPRRDTTTTSTQALMLLNGPWTLGRAHAFAARVERLTPGSAGQRDWISLAYRLAMTRPAEPAEIEEGAAFIRRVEGASRLAGTPGRARGAGRFLPCAPQQQRVPLHRLGCCHAGSSSRNRPPAASPDADDPARDWLLHAGAGLGGLALGDLLAARPVGRDRGESRRRAASVAPGVDRRRREA